MHMYPKRACLEGLEVEIFKLVSYSATPEQWTEWLRVPLEHAAARGNLDLFNKLLGAGADGGAGWRGCRGRTLLDAAAVGGNEDIVSGLLRVGAQPDVKVVSCSSKRSALGTATVLGHEAVARRLLVAGADVNFQDPMLKRSVLAEATRGGHEQLVTDLLIGGANPNCRDGDDGSCPLHCAANEGYDGIVSTLLLRGADKDALDNHEETPLMWASEVDEVSAVETVLAAGADVDVRNTEGFSALDIAAVEGCCDAMKVIIRHGVDVNADDDHGCTALHAAAEYDQPDAVDVLVEAGADIELRTDAGSTPLAIAARFSKCKALLMLLQHGAKLDVENDVGDTPLHMACCDHVKGLNAAVDLLLRLGADETAVNDGGLTPEELLDGEGVSDDNLATQDEIERARLLLARAPADRAWRRRGWLVILRSRDSKAIAGVSTCSSDSHGAGGDAGGSEVTMSERMADDEDDGPGKTGKGVGGEVEAGGGEEVEYRAKGQLGLEMDGAIRTASVVGRDVGGEGGDERLRLEVVQLLGLGLEGVFRSVVGFL